MDREELYATHQRLCHNALALMKKKNADYAQNSDPFQNLRVCEVLGTPAEIGILIRCMDKFARIAKAANGNELQVRDESVQDSIVDVINYMVILQGMIMEKSEPAKPVVFGITSQDQLDLINQSNAQRNQPQQANL